MASAASAASRPSEGAEMRPQVTKTRDSIIPTVNETIRALSQSADRSAATIDRFRNDYQKLQHLAQIIKGRLDQTEGAVAQLTAENELLLRDAEEAEAVAREYLPLADKTASASDAAAAGSVQEEVPVARLANTVRQITAQTQAITKRAEEAEAALATAHAHLVESSGERDTLAGRVQELGDALADANAHLAEKTAFEERIAALQRANTLLEEANESSRADREETKAAVDSLAEDLQAAQRQIAELSTAAETAKTETRAANEALKAVTMRATIAEESLATVTKTAALARETLGKEIEAILASIQRTKAERNASQARIQELEAQLRERPVQ